MGLFSNGEVKRILVTGNAGAGKSTLAGLLAERLGLPLHGVDKVVWKSGWVKAERDEVRRRVGEIVSEESWVLDGVTEQGMEAADVIVFLDVPRRVSYWRAWKRNMRYLFKSRPELPPHCPEIKIIPRLWKLIWRFPSKVRPKIMKYKEQGDGKCFYHLRSRCDYEKFLREV